ncbi:phage minor capsid protein [Nocardia sp. NPDC051052]|uniref:phage minor capsid protein n=1 Tax=Nocardia sp. NPDC051052 TaxID=3364322 RepID=UPI0037A55616
MPMDPGQASLLTHTVADIYADAEQQLIDLTARYASQGVDGPQWSTHQRTQIARFRAAVTQLLHQLGNTSANRIRSAVLEAATIGDRAALADLRRRLPDSAVRHSSTIDPAAIHALAVDTIRAITGTHPRILRSAEDHYRHIITQVTGRTVTGIVTVRQALQQALDRFASAGIEGFTDTAGRRWSMDTYAEVAIRTALVRALNAGHAARLVAAGHDLVVVSAHPRPAPQCRPYEGQVLSLTGRTPNGPRTLPAGLGTGNATVVVVASLAEAQARGLHHPNCRHRYTVWRPGLRLPDIPPDDPQGYRDEQRLRALERRARAARRVQATAITPAAARAAHDRVAAVEAAITAHVATSGVQRQRWRERPRVASTFRRPA